MCACSLVINSHAVPALIDGLWLDGAQRDLGLLVGPVTHAQKQLLFRRHATDSTPVLAVTAEEGNSPPQISSELGCVISAF